ncbi:hypothetical protein [Bacillus sp. FJAT-50079]|uniref:hypothetical protein n=1 Tax=Bacillus sp. FJAT-50079 TaxID=2833577 RepID=UPI001BC971BA|nr:hypothetical protein [Bacillus sp. FJAT-50079]MBS4209799.1 hypothetical protein [Bacillus sp. FJAT-50079]
MTRQDLLAKLEFIRVQLEQMEIMLEEKMRNEKQAMKTEMERTNERARRAIHRLDVTTKANEQTYKVS